MMCSRLRLLLSLAWVPMIALQVGCADQPTWKTLQENRKGSRAIEEMEGRRAEEHLQRALEDRPYQAEVHLNLGLAARLLGRVDDAAKSYGNARRYAREGDVEMEFLSHYNAGEASQAAKKIDEALASYQKALAARPDSVETKTNIELLLQGGQGQGEGDSQQQAGQDQQKKEGQDPKDGEDDGKPKERQVSKKYQPREFKGELSESDVRKILGEIKQQEQKIRADYNRKEAKERPRGKDW